MADTYLTRLDLWGFLPIPDQLFTRLGWAEGDLISIEVASDSLILTKETDENAKIIRSSRAHSPAHYSR